MRLIFLRREDSYVTETAYQKNLIRKLYAIFPGCVILRNDPRYQQGMLDLTLLWGRNWASLEVKASEDAAVQPNQNFFVQQLDNMSFAAFIYPENEEEVLGALQQAFEPPRRARFSES
jgi:hypothetical protein